MQKVDFEAPAGEMITIMLSETININNKQRHEKCKNIVYIHANAINELVYAANRSTFTYPFIVFNGMYQKRRNSRWYIFS